MKRIYIFALAVGLVIGSFAGHHSARAQAVNHDAIITSLMAMKTGIDHMIQLVERHKAGTVAVGPESVVLSPAQLNQLLARYNALKTDLVAQFATLP